MKLTWFKSLDMTTGLDSVVDTPEENWSILNELYKALNYRTNAWEIVEVQTATDKWGRNGIGLLIVKNKVSGLNYEPHLIFKYYYDSDDDKQYLKFIPCKSYDSSKDLCEQEGAISDGTNCETFKTLMDYLPYNPQPKIYSNFLVNLLITDYSISFTLPQILLGRYEDRIYFNGFFKFQVFNCLDKDNGGMYITNYWHETADKALIFYNGYWWGDTESGILTRKHKLDVDKSVGFRHYPQPNSSVSACPIAYFVDTNFDTDVEEWKFIGYSYENYSISSYYHPNIVNIKDINGEQKLCYRFPEVYDIASKLNLALLVEESEFEIVSEKY